MKTQAKLKAGQETETLAMIRARQVLETILSDKNLDFDHFSIEVFVAG